MVYCTCETSEFILQDEAALTAHIWILWPQNQESNATMLRRVSVMSANWSSGRLTCNMGCSRQSLMKVAQVNGKRLQACICYVLQMDVFITCF